MGADARMKPIEIDIHRHASRDVHVIPLCDLRTHEETRECWCGPDYLDDPGYASVIVHHALDGRELVERYGLQ